MLTTPQLDELDIELVMKFTGVNRQQATKAYIKNDNDFINAIWDLKESNG